MPPTITTEADIKQVWQRSLEREAIRHGEACISQIPVARKERFAVLLRTAMAFLGRAYRGSPQAEQILRTGLAYNPRDPFQKINLLYRLLQDIPERPPRHEPDDSDIRAVLPGMIESAQREAAARVAMSQVSRL